MSSITKEEFLELEKSLIEKSNSGDITACKQLGDIYYQGYLGNEKNHEKAFPYWKKAADAGDASAAGMIGVRLFSGIYGKGRESEAIPYLLAAADAGVNGSGPQYMVGMAYDLGRGCREDKVLAEKYYRLAALQNDANAQYGLGRLLFLKEGDDVEYMHWICCAHINGNKDATDLLNVFINNSDDQSSAKETIEKCIEDVKKNGIVPKKENNVSRREGCYIATAIYGSYNASEVMTLRRYRDEVLLKCWWGKAFVDIYYRISPSIAERLKNASVINRLVRRFLNHFICKLKKNLGYTSEMSKNC